MLRNYSSDKISDRFISARNKEREIILDKYKIDDDSDKKYIEDIYQTPRCKSQTKSRQLNYIENDETFGQKIYLNLLKTQIFQSTNSRSNYSDKSFRGYKTEPKQNIIKNLNKSFFNNDNITNDINSNNILVKSNAENINNSRNDSKNMLQITKNKNCNIYAKNILTNNYSLLITKKVRNYLFQKRLYEDNGKINNSNGNVFKERYKTFLNLELDDNETTLNYLKYKSIPKISYKVLDAPNLRDDFYLNLVDWSKQNIVAVGLENKLYTWNAKYSDVSFISELSNEENYYTSLSFNSDGQYLISSSTDGNIFIRDIEKEKDELIYNGLSNGRICSICKMNSNPNVFSFGSKDLKIKTIDLRAKLNPVLNYTGHTREICGLKWSLDDKKLASGGDDNLLFIWDIRKEDPEKKFISHTSAIKALDWSTFKFGHLISGGGTQDMTLKLWNINNMSLVDSINTSSQICNIAFSKISHEFVTTHGYKNNYIYVWDSRTMKIKATLKGHKQRVVYMALSPDSRKIVTGAGDETIRFWKTFGYENQKYDFYNNAPEINLGNNDDLINSNDNNKKENDFSKYDVR